LKNNDSDKKGLFSPRKWIIFNKVLISKIKIITYW